MAHCQILHTKDDIGHCDNCLGVDPAVFLHRWMTPAALATLIASHTTEHMGDCIEHNLNFYAVLGFPKSGWMLDVSATIDLRPDDGPDEGHDSDWYQKGFCFMCPKRHPKLRFLHTLHHEAAGLTIEGVGSICIKNLTGESTTAKRIEATLRRAAAKRRQKRMRDYEARVQVEERLERFEREQARMDEEERLGYEGMIRQRAATRRLAHLIKDPQLAQEAASFFENFFLSKAGNHCIRLYQGDKERRFIIMPSPNYRGRFMILRSIDEGKPSRVLAHCDYPSIDEAKHALWIARYLLRIV